MRSDQPSPNFVFLGDLRRSSQWLNRGLDRLVQDAIEKNASTLGKLVRVMREREGW